MALASGKEEVIYAVLDARGQVDGLYAVNIFEGGDIVDYGDYTSVHPLNTEDQIAYENGVVSFHSDAQRVYYQGNLSDRNLPWRFSLTYRLNGQIIEADEADGSADRRTGSYGYARAHGRTRSYAHAHRRTHGNGYACAHRSARERTGAG